MKNPLAQFAKFRKQAIRRKDQTSDYLMLATADAKANPHVRTVLIKSADERGIGFVTNRFGRKVEHFKKHRRVEGCVVWPSLTLQIRLSGKITPMPRAQVDRLWKMRPREAQILYHLGLKQSHVIPSYDYLKKKVAALARRWKNKKILPTANTYVGYILRPTMIEFLHHNPTRLNLRECYEKRAKGWKKKILAP